MNISITWAPVLVQAVADAIAYHTQLLRSETLRNREDYEEHLLQLERFFEHVKEEYKRVEDQAGVPLEKLV